MLYFIKYAIILITMTQKPTGKIEKYCRKHNITIAKLSQMTGLSLQKLYRLNIYPDLRVKLSTLKHIYERTTDVLGEGNGLPAIEYMGRDTLAYLLGTASLSQSGHDQTEIDVVPNSNPDDSPIPTSDDYYRDYINREVGDLNAN